MQVTRLHTAGENQQNGFMYTVIQNGCMVPQVFAFA